MRILAAAFIIAFLVPPVGYKAEVEAFRKQREAEIGGEAGWAALTGLHWLSKGVQTVGRASSNAVVLTAPSAPERIGTLTVGEHEVLLQVAAGIPARVKGTLVTRFQFEPNAPIEESVTIGGMRLIVIERGSRLGLRVWDRASPSRRAFKGLHWYGIDQKWRVEAKFVPHQPAPKARVGNIIGETVEMTNPGSAVFVVNGKRYELEALLEEDDADELFFMFHDATSAKTTYGAGRYLYTPLPKNGRVTLDFNRAMNPPCAFTDFATCPLPLQKNRLDLAIEAGELQYKEHP